MTYQEELNDLGVEVYEKNDDYKESLSELRKKVRREDRAVKRLDNHGTQKVLHRRKAKKNPSLEGV